MVVSPGLDDALLSGFTQSRGRCDWGVVVDAMTQVPGTVAPLVLDAFVSYARRDAPRVMQVVEAARARGRVMWVDEDNIPPGAPWRTELGTAIEAANAVVCCVSPAWLASEECQREYRRAIELGKRLIPVLVSRVERLPDALAALQWIDAGGSADPDSAAAAVLEIGRASCRERV